MDGTQRLLNLIEECLGRLHEQQKQKSLQLARRLNPKLTEEDLLNPDNFEYLVNDPRFTYEDGVAAGILAAKIALRAEFQAIDKTN